ncbi:MAG: hypothetical protein Q8P03_00605, partial [bacterium]|nr:hypothetical protein [bacterium]
NKKTMSKKQFKIKQTAILGAGMILSLLSLYVFQVNSLTTLAYSAKNQETALTNIAEESADLETFHRQNFGVSSLEQLAKILRFEKIAKVTYIHILTGTVAQNR